MRRILFLLFLSVVNFNSFSQSYFKNECGFDKILQFTNQDYVLNEIKSHEMLLDKSNRRIVDNDTTYVIQVVVHVLYNNDNFQENIPDAIIQSQIDALNRDFNLKNEDTLNLRDEFVQFRGNAKIRFELAKVKPNGLPTNGITRKFTKSTSFNPLLELHKQADLLGRSDYGGTVGWAVKKYLNIWVCNLNYDHEVGGGFLGGYAYPPANLEHWETRIIVGNDTLVQSNALNRGNNDGVCIDYRFFGQNNFYNQDSLGGSLRYGLGRTTVHEVGHYLGLRHIWGDALDTLGVKTPPGCEVDDFIEDTPNSIQAYANYFNRNNICDTFVNSCDVPYPADGVDYPDMFENYMDYSTDLCYNLFTKQQIEFMRYVLLSRRKEIIVDKFVEQVSTPVKNNVINQFKVYPNPASQSLTIQLLNDTKTESLALINSLGQEVRSQLVAENTNQIILDISDLPKGIYQLQLRSKGNIGAQKVVIE